MRFDPRTRLLGTSLFANVAKWDQKSFIRSIQQGTVTITNGNFTANATVTAFAAGTAILLPTGVTYNVDETASTRYCGYIQIASTTSISGTRSANSNDLSLGFTVLELFPGVLKSVQQGTIALAAVISNTATITAVDPNKSICLCLGATTDDVTGSGGRDYHRAVLTNSTTVTASKGIAAGSGTVGWYVAEFW